MALIDNSNEQAAMKVVRLGIIGLGRFSRYHLNALRQQPDVQLVAVADPDHSRRLEVSAEWKCSHYEEWRQMIAAGGLDAVLVLTPETMHTEPVLAALQAGYHVFVEKPFATRAEEADQMLLAAKAANKLLMVGHVSRFDPRLIEIRHALEQGRIGELRSIYARRNNPKKYFSIYQRTNPIYILGIHDIDIINWLSGAQVEEVYARSSSGSGSAPDLIWTMLKYTNGLIAVIENNWLMPEQAPAEMDIGMEIVGEEGTIHFQDPDQSLTFWSDKGVKHPASYLWTETYGVYAGHLLEEMKHFYACVRQNQPSMILHASEAREAVRIAEAIVRSCELGQPVRLLP